MIAKKGHNSAFNLNLALLSLRRYAVGLELAEQFGFDDLPDVIMYPTGGGTGLIGMWKAFAELKAIGIISAVGRCRLNTSG